MNNQFLLMHRQLENILVNRYAKITDSDSSEVSLEEFAREIRNPSEEIEARIREIRSCYKSHGGGKAGKKAIGELKSQLPAFTLNATAGGGGGGGGRWFELASAI